MEVGHVVRFASQQHPFFIEATPCLDLDCSCSLMELTLTEIDPSNPALRDRLTFTLRVCLKTWTEHNPPPRSLEVESLAHEFLARLPSQRIRELGDEFTRARAVKRRLQSWTLPGPVEELVGYSELLDEGGGIREGHGDQNFFFVFEGREFLIEDHYCANPRCDCQQVHVEFWERVHRPSPKRGIQIQQRLMVTLNLDGKLQETRFTEETPSTTKYLLTAWIRRCGYQLDAFRRRYELIKAIGSRSFPEPPPTPVRRESKLSPLRSRAAEPRLPSRVGRNDPCPCGSGRKFKRCCGQRVAK